MCIQFKKKFGFTIVEILVVLVIVGIVSGVLIGFQRQGIVSGKSKVSAENLRQIGVASGLYAAAYDDFLPPYLTHSGESGPVNPDGSHGEPAKAWKECLLAYGMADGQFYAPLDPWARKYGPKVNLDDHRFSSYRHNGSLSFMRSGKVLYLSLTGIEKPSDTIHVYENGKGQIRSPKDQRLYDVPYDDKAFEVLYFDGHVKRISKQY